MTFKKTLLLQLVILAIGAVVFAMQYSALPATVPVHWGLNGKPDRFGSKNEFLWLHGLMGLMPIGFTFLFNALKTGNDGKPIEQKTRETMFATSLLLSVFFTGLTLAIMKSAGAGSGSDSSLVLKVVMGGVGLLFAFLGRASRDIQPNPYMGIRLPWTLKNAEVWRESHRRMGDSWFYGGIFCAVIAIIGLPFYIPLAAILFLSFWPIWDSWQVAKRIAGTG